MENGVTRICPRCGDEESEATGPIQPIAPDDEREICARCYTEEFGRSSVVKLYAFLAHVQGRKPETEDDAQRHAILTMIAPMVGSFIPDDPDELDRMLLTLAQWALEMRSDSAPPWAIESPPKTEQEGTTNDPNPPRDDPPPPAEAGEAAAIAGPDSPDGSPAAD